VKDGERHSGFEVYASRLYSVNAVHSLLTVSFIFHKQKRCGAPPFPVGEIGRKPRNMEYFEIQVNEREDF
jgi:hypothetical protein